MFDCAKEAENEAKFWRNQAHGRVRDRGKCAKGAENEAKLWRNQAHGRVRDKKKRTSIFMRKETPLGTRGGQFPRGTQGNPESSPTKLSLAPSEEEKEAILAKERALGSRV
ncbi:hypothetical protein L1987_15711 [Smallanthus sonchifolius]|uniref:Uncharacterized protein n=1 Tax=Smallanthus sonchifolius TaxID=185202 RepID=A0ACB9J8H1_9ASTR|nr:hypothetical protein L1987_15711 [Smallanthus sonchifolius]